jgi:uncharacterized protein
MKNKNVKSSLLLNPVARIILGLSVCFVVFIVAQNVTSNLLGITNLDKNFRNLLKGIISSILVLYTYRIFYKYIEKRSVSEISTKGIMKNLMLGILIGVVLQCLTVLVIDLNGDFKILSINPLSFVIILLTVAFSVAIFEEILIRGILFRIIEEKLGSYIALIISAIIFGGLHLINPNSTFISAIYNVPRI